MGGHCTRFVLEIAHKVGALRESWSCEERLEPIAYFELSDKRSSICYREAIFFGSSRGLYFIAERSKAIISSRN